MFPKRLLSYITGIILIPLVWILLKSVFNVSDRYLPSIGSVLDAFGSIRPNIFIHFSWSLGRLVIGFVGGVALGIFIAMQLYKHATLGLLLLPTIQSLRSVPPAATIPFFLIWFGFSETGKFLLIFLGIAFNLTITTLEILNRIPEKYQIMFRSFQTTPQQHVREFALPFAMEKLLPTLRFSLSTAIGLVVVSEFLGSQIGLGYLIDTARSTFSMNVIFAAMILFGVMNFLMDRSLVYYWKKQIFWKI